MAKSDRRLNEEISEIGGNMNPWLKGLISALLSGIATGAGTVFFVPVSINSGNFKVLGYMILVGAIIGLINYLAKSPFPEG